MNINFKSVKLHNFFSFADAFVNLDNNQYTIVTGENKYKNDCAARNGIGKSALFDSIVWALTGETIRGTKDIVNDKAIDGAFVELCFSVDNNYYKITRYKEYQKIGTNLKIIINDEDKSGKGIRDSEKILEQYLPDLTSSFIGSVIILGQGLPQRFTNNTPSGRKDVLEKLSKSDFMIDDLKIKLSNRKSTLTNEIRDVDDNLIKLNTQISMFNSSLTKIDSDLENLKGPESLTFNIDDLNNEKVQVNEKLDELKNKYDSLDLDINSFKSQLMDLTRKQYDEDNKLGESYKPVLDDINKRVNEQYLKVNSLRNQINQLKNITDICPTCHQKLPDVHIVDTTEMENDLDYEQSCLDKLNSEAKSKNDELSTCRKELKEKFKQLMDQKQKDINDYSCEQSNLNIEIDEQNKRLSSILEDINSYNFIINQYESNKKRLQDEKLSIEQSLKDSNDKVLYYNISKEKLNNRLEIINKMITIATRDFRGFLLSEVIKFIDERSKAYCLDIFENNSIEFKLNGNNIEITYLGKQYENLSGGEKQKIDIIIQFSIRDMLIKFLNFSSNILVLDEIFDNLDNVGCQKVLDLISNKLTDVASVFIITHHQDIDIPYDNQINIIKDETGISKVN